MTDQDWKARLAAAIEASGKSQREISLAAGKGPGYVNSLLHEGKDPTVGNLMRICQAANVSVYQVLGGFPMSPEHEELLRRLLETEEDVQRSILLLLERGRKREENREPPAESRDPRSATQK